MSPFYQLALVAAVYASAVLATPLSTPPHILPQRGSWSPAPLLASEHPHGSVNNSYIVILKNDVHPDVKQNHLTFVQNLHAANPLLDEFSGVQQVYDGHIHGYAGRFTEEVLEQLRMRPEVEYIEKDQIVKTQEIETQKSAPWVRSRSLFLVNGTL